MNKIQQRLIFEKEYQDKLKIKYENGLKVIWNNDPKMISYGMKQLVYLVPICNNQFLIPIDKISIEKEFLFGYSDFGQGRSMTENDSLMDTVKQNLEAYFKSKNLSSIDSMIYELEKIVAGNSTKTPVHYLHYYSCPPDSPCHDFTLTSPYDPSPVSGETFDLDIEDVKNILYGYKLFREYTNNKLDSYLKKYGTKHLIVSSYWIDR